MIRPSIFGITCLAALASCGGNDLVLPGQGEPAHIQIIHGDPQSGRVGEALADSLVAKVTDVNDQPVPGASVVFQLTDASPGTQFLPDTASTGMDGLASAQIVLGSEVGNFNGLAQVVVSGNQSPIQPATFTLHALPASANGLSLVSGDKQSAPAGSPLPAPLVVKVADAFGNPVSGVTITWATAGGGTLSASTTQTGDDGQTSVQLTLGTTAGAQSVTASAEGLAGSPVTFNLTATAGSASSISIVSGDGQTGAAGAPLGAALVVKVVDGSGNPVIGATVDWAVTAGGGSPNPASSTTDANGQASTSWTLGGTPGPNTLTASVASLGTVTFSATGVSGAPSRLAVLTQPSETAQIGTPFGRQPVIQVRDGQGNDVAQGGVSVTAAIASGAGTLGGTTTRATDAQGRASFTDLQINGATGTHTLIFAAAGFTSVNSTAINITAPARVATSVGFVQQPTNTTAGATITPAVTVEIRDQFGARMTGATNSVSLAIGNNPGNPAGTLSGGAAVAAVNGVATFSGLSIDNAGTGYTLTASSTGLTGATSTTFNITTPAPVATSLAFVAQPQNTAAGATMSAVTVEIRDQFSNRLTTATNSVTLAIGNNPGNPAGTLSGTKTVAAVNGLATFSDLSIDNTGTGYTLTASSTGLTGATSNTLDITAP